MKSFSSRPNRQSSPFIKVLESYRAARAIAVVTKSDPDKVWKTVRSLGRMIRRWVQNEGLINTSKRIKESEKHFLLTGKSL